MDLPVYVKSVLIEIQISCVRGYVRVHKNKNKRVPDLKSS